MMAVFFIEIHEGRRKYYKKNGIISTIKCILWYSIKYSETMYDIINTKKEFNLYEESMMKRLSQEKLSELIRNLRTSMGITQEELSEKTGINRQMIGRMEQNKYIPSILQLEELARVLDFDITSLFEEQEPTVYTAFRKSSMSEEEKRGVDHMFEMMMAAKQQILLRKALHHE